MQILGLYYTRRSRGSTLRNLLKTLKEFYNVQLFLPIVLTMEHGSFSTNPDHISIFPAFYSVNRRSTIPQVLVQSFGDKYVYARDSSFLGLSIYLFDSSDMPSIYALAMDVSTIFPRIGWINLMFERRCAIVSFLFIVNVHNRTWSKGHMYCFSHYRRLKKGCLSSPIWVTYAYVTGPRYDENTDSNIPEIGWDGSCERTLLCTICGWVMQRAELCKFPISMPSCDSFTLKKFRDLYLHKKRWLIVSEKLHFSRSVSSRFHQEHMNVCVI